MKPCETIGERLEKRRTELRLTQEDVAAKVVLTNPSDGKEVQLSVNAYKMYESGKIDPKVKTVEALAAALAVPPGWLAFGNGASKLTQAEMVH